MTATLERIAFEQSRLMEFFSEKELRAQIGAERHDWARALLKELLDNALDACEAAGIAPVIEVHADDDRLTVTDNGPGLPASIVEKSLDYSLRISTNASYVAPTCGQLV